MSRMQIGAIALFTALFLSSCGSNSVSKGELLGYWQLTQSIDSDGTVTQVSKDKPIIAYFQESQIILAQEDTSPSTTNYRLEGKSIINTKTNKTEAEIASVDSRELRLRGGKDQPAESQKTIKVFTRTNEAAYLAISK